jgi:hypothetical protein
MVPSFRSFLRLLTVSFAAIAPAAPLALAHEASPPASQQVTADHSTAAAFGLRSLRNADGDRLDPRTGTTVAGTPSHGA